MPPLAARKLLENEPSVQKPTLLVQQRFAGLVSRACLAVGTNEALRALDAYRTSCCKSYYEHHAPNGVAFRPDHGPSQRTAVQREAWAPVRTVRESCASPLRLN